MPEYDDIPEGFSVASGNTYDDIPEGFSVASADPSALDYAGGVGEAIATVGRNTAALSASGLAGIGGMIAGMVPGGESPSEKAARWQSGTQNALSYEPQGQAAQQYLQGAGAVGESLTRAARYPVAGAMTAASLLAGQGWNQASEGAGQIIDQGIGKAFGDRAMESSGSPLLATAVEVVPTAAATLLGARNPVARRPAPTAVPSAAPNLLRADVAQPAPAMPFPEQASIPIRPAYEPVAQAVRTGKPQKAAQQVLPDMETIESAKRLGVDLNPEHYSTNSGFQDVARALKSQPGSRLEMGEKRALETLSTRADSYVQDLGGSLDKSGLSDEILSGYRTNIDELSTNAGQLYDRVEAAIPKATRVDVSEVRAFIDQRLADLGGDASLLSAPERRLLTLVRKKGEDGKMVDIEPTYGALDRVRKDVGDGYSSKGVFKDESSRTLDEVYGLLSNVQDGVADAFGMGEVYTTAKGLVQQRKGLESQAQALFGKQLANSLVPQMRGAASALSRGDVGNLNKLMAALPENARSDMAATIIGELFAGGSRRGGSLGQGFVGTWESLNRNKAAKDALFKYLPPESRQRFDDLGRVMTGIVKANTKPLSNPSGSAGPIIKAINDGTAIDRAYGFAKGAAAEAVTTSTGTPGLGAAAAWLSKNKTPRTEAADKMLSSPEFKDAVDKAVKGQMAEANAALAKSPSYKAWFGRLDKESQAQIARVGFISWLISETQ